MDSDSDSDYYERPLDEVQEDQPSPIMMVGTEVLPKIQGNSVKFADPDITGTWVEGRITPPDPKVDTCLDRLVMCLDLHPKIDKYIISTEFAKKTKKMHHHFVARLTDNYCDEDFRVDLRKVFPELNSGHLYHMKMCDDPWTCMLYTVKDKGDIRFKGYSVQEQELIKRSSYKKFSKEEFKIALNKLDTAFMISLDFVSTSNGRMYDAQVRYITELCKLRAEFNQVSNWNYCFNKSETMMIRKFGDSFLKPLVTEKMERQYPRFR